MSKVRLKQLAQDGATNGQVPTWNNTLGIWEPDAAGGGAGMAQNTYATGGASPSGVQFSANNDALASLTQLNFADSSSVDNNFSAAYGAVKVNDYIVLRDNAGGAAHGTFLVTATQDFTTFWRFTVTPADVSGSFVNGNSYDIWILGGRNVTTTAPANVTKAAAAVGTATTAARSDHKHDVTTAAPAGTAVRVGNSAAEGAATTLARSDHTHTVAAGTPVNVTKAANAAGSALTFARSDHKHDVTTAAPSTVGTANSEGAATSLARSDHVHNHGSQTVGTHHAAVIAGSTSGFMIGSDKTKLNSLIIPSGFSWKIPVRVATTAAGTLATSFENGDTIDGVVLATGNRILIKNQATGAENGIYTVNASGAPTRATDLPATGSAASLVVVAKEGTTNADTPWQCTNNTGSDVVATDALVFAAFGGGGGSGDVTGGAASAVGEIATYTGTGGKAIGRSDVLLGGATPTTGTRTLGASALMSGAYLATAGSSVNSSGSGSVALGYVSGDASINATGLGSVSLGYCVESGSGTLATITNSALGALIVGATAQTVSGTAKINAAAGGSFVGGYASQSGLIEGISASNGCFSHGYADGSGSIIRVTGALGGFASGSAQSGGTIITSGKGGFASGTADIQSGGTTGAISASGLGSFAGGSALGVVSNGVAQITASGSGSFAWGNILAIAATSSIAATATNSVQFGIGTNAVANSMQVGDTTNGLRLISGGTTSTVAGSFWVNGSSQVVMRSAAQNQTFSYPTVSGSTAGNAALQNLLAALAGMNLINDTTT